MAPTAVENLVKDHSFAAPSSPKAGNPQSQARSDLDTQSGSYRLYTYTVSRVPIAAVAYANEESARERERLSAPRSGGGGWLQPAVTVRDSGLLGRSGV